MGFNLQISMDWSPTSVNQVPQLNIRADQKKAGFLPIGPVTDNIFKYLSSLELIRYSRTNKHGYTAIADYIPHAFSITDLLGRYFSQSDVLAFRFLQAQTGTIISGSSALQFFGRVCYSESDLDVYVEARHAAPMLEWLPHAGYTLLVDPVDPDGKVLTKKLATLDKEVQAETGIFMQSLEDLEAAYRKRCMVKVYNFQKDSDPTKKVQLILTYNNPLELILAFHSTCVMNIITHNTAYSLFPYATFEQKVSLVIEKSRDEKCLDKYRTRGWTILDKVPPIEAYDPTSDFYAPSRIEGRGVVRYVGDKRCWTIPLSPKIGPGKPEVMTRKYLNSWQIIHDLPIRYNTTGTDLKFKILRSRRLGNTYTVALKPAIFLEPILIGLESQLGHRLDKEVEDLLRNSFEAFNGP